MANTPIGRRQVILATTCLGLVATLPVRGVAQQSGPAGSLRVSPSSIGEYHRKILVETTRLLDGQPLFTDKAFDLQIDSLVRAGVIGQDNAEVLKAFTRRLTSGRAFEEIVQDLEAIAEKLKAATNEVAAALGGIAQDSIGYVKEFAGKLNKKDLALVIAHDVQGALTGAGTGPALGAVLAGLGVTAGAVFGALMGGSSSSVIGALEPKQ